MTGENLDVEVQGTATPDEVAAIVTALTRRAPETSADPERDRYERWRTQRLAALGFAAKRDLTR